MSIQALRERRGALANEAKKLLADNPTWTAANQTRFDEIEAEISGVETQIKNVQKVLDRDADERVNGQVAEAAARGARDNPKNESLRIYNAWLRGGDAALSNEDWKHVRNTMSTTTGSQGGYTVQAEIAKSLIDALKDFGGVREVAEVFSTTEGNDLSWPTTDGTSEVGELIAQNTTATAADPSFGTVTLSVYKFSSKIIAVPMELLQDSVIDVEAFVQRRIASRLGRVTNTYFTTGTGSSQPMGLLTAAGSGKVGATGSTLTVGYDDLIDMVHSIDPAYRRLSPGWMMNDASLKVIRKLKDTTGRPIWTPAYDDGIKGGAPDQLLGYGITVNTDMPVMAANAKPILFGSFREGFKVRDVMAAQLFRFTDSAYTKLGQVGFLAWMRSGSQCVDAAGIKFYQNSAS